MKVNPYRKWRRSITVLLSLVFILVASQILWGAPKLNPAAKGGDCAACHGEEKVLPDNHMDTKAMDWKGCSMCHQGEKSLAGKLPGMHHHELAGIGCTECHGKTDKPEPLAMEKCIACHGSTEKLAEKTKDIKPHNPHDSPHYGTDLDCTLCHHQHKKSENYCAQCHDFNFVVP